MFPIIFKLGPISIYSYGLMIAIAFMVVLFLIKKEAKAQDIPYQLIWDLCFWILIFGIIGARLLYVVLNIDYFKDYPFEIFKIYHGGLTLYGGIILGVLVGIIYLKKKKIAILKTLDLIAPYIALAQAIGRVGCFLNGCCFGYESISYGIYFPVHNKILIPIQLYSSLLNLIIFIILRVFQRRVFPRGNLFFLYLILYSTKRFFVEFFRADSPKVCFGLSIFQVISILIFFICLFIFLVRLRLGNLITRKISLSADRQEFQPTFNADFRKSNADFADKIF